MKTVFVCSAYGGSEANLILARDYCKFVTDSGLAPFAPHLIYTQFLDDSFKQERELGINAGLAFLERCGEMWVFVKGGVISGGMQKEIDFASENGIKIMYFTINDTKIHNFYPINGKIMPREEMPTQLNSKTDRAMADVAESLNNGQTYEEVMQWLDFLTPDSVEPDETMDKQWEENYRNK
jgi:hypothetical protein